MATRSAQPAAIAMIARLVTWLAPCGLPSALLQRVNPFWDARVRPDHVKRRGLPPPWASTAGACRNYLLEPATAGRGRARAHGRDPCARPAGTAREAC